MKQTHLLAYLTILLVNAFWLGLGYYWSYTHFIERDVFLPIYPGTISFFISRYRSVLYYYAKSRSAKSYSSSWRH